MANLTVTVEVLVRPRGFIKDIEWIYEGYVSPAFTSSTVGQESCGSIRALAVSCAVERASVREPKVHYAACNVKQKEGFQQYQVWVQDHNAQIHCIENADQEVRLQPQPLEIAKDHKPKEAE